MITKSQHLYLRLAIGFVFMSFGCFILKNIRIPGDTVIAREPDTTLHDIIYFNAENFVNFCGMVAFTNLCYFISSIYPNLMAVTQLKRLALVMSAIIFCRCIGHIFTYYEVTAYELILDITLISLIFITRKPYYTHAADT